MQKLDALNIVLDAIGVYPVTQWDSPHPDAVRARDTVSRYSTEVQSRGWWCNREYNLTLTPEALTKKILVPSNTLLIDSTDMRLNYVRRGKYMYDPAQHTYEFDGPVQVHIIIELPFDDVPNSLQNYIARTAALDFSIIREGDQNKVSQLEKMMYQARSQAFADELRDSNYNIFNSGLPQRVIAGVRPAVRRY